MRFISARAHKAGQPQKLTGHGAEAGILSTTAFSFRRLRRLRTEEAASGWTMSSSIKGALRLDEATMLGRAVSKRSLGRAKVLGLPRGGASLGRRRRLAGGDCEPVLGERRGLMETGGTTTSEARRRLERLTVMMSGK